MKRISQFTFAMLLAAACCVMLGCPPANEPAADDTPAPTDASEPADASEPTDASEPADAAASDATSATDGEASDVVAATNSAQPATAKELTFAGKDALIQFVGVHADPEKPDPRTGTFQTFIVVATVEDDALQSFTVDIETPSLSTEIDKLTNHLKSADFFNVNEFPTAKFVTTSIDDAGDGKVNITGDLTLLETTKSITFPATVSTADRLKLDATFTIDRTEFGMDYGVENVKKEVEMTVKIPK